MHQHSRLVEALTAAENLFIGWDDIPGLFRRRSALVERADELGKQYRLEVDMEAPASGSSRSATSSASRSCGR